MQHRIHNQTLFVAALSVYLGLLIVGAPPQVLAQNSEKVTERNKINIIFPGEGYVFTFDLNPIIELNKLSAGESLPITLSGKLVPLQQEQTDWQITAVAGNQKIVGFLQKEFFPPAILSPPKLPLIVKEIYQSVEIDRDVIKITRNAQYNEIKKATEMAFIFNRMVQYAKNSSSKKEIVGNLYLLNTQVVSENNQVFIVTRLPRAGLDALLKADEKANWVWAFFRNFWSSKAAHLSSNFLLKS